jgi:hypothetical protein
MAPKDQVWLRGSDFPSRRLDLLSIFIVDAHDLVVRRPIGFQKFVKFGVNGLCVPVFRSLNNQRHAPGCQSGNRVPPQAVTQRDPGQAIECKDDKRCRTGCEHASLCQPLPSFFECHLAKRAQARSRSRRSRPLAYSRTSSLHLTLCRSSKSEIPSGPSTTACPSITNDCLPSLIDDLGIEACVLDIYWTRRGGRERSH